MGFVLDVDLETSQGPSHEVYVRIESLTFNKVTSMIQFQITYWQDRDHAIRFNRTYMSESKKSAIGLIQEKVIYFSNENSDGEEFLLPHHMKVPVVRVQEVEVPLIEEVEVETDVPYVSFDENGDEITKYRKIVKTEQKQTGVEIEEQEVIDTTLLKDTFGFCYSKIKQELSNFFPEEKILTVR